MKTALILILLTLFVLIGWYFFSTPKSTTLTDNSAENELPTLSDTERKQLNEVREAMAQHALPIIEITPMAEKPKTPWESRFGGEAYWPADMPWPQTPKGKPLYLLAQINFSEVPELAGYPTHGILQFFIDSDDLWGLAFAGKNDDAKAVATTPNGFRVVYHEQPIMDASALKANPIKDEDHHLPVAGSYALRFKKASQPPTLQDYRMGQYGIDVDALPDSVAEQIWNNEKNAFGSKIGGYASFTQEDPRGYIAPDETWLLLFQMDSFTQDGVDIMWGDAGIANFFIRPEDLANRDFSRVWYNWDCH